MRGFLNSRFASILLQLPLVSLFFMSIFFYYNFYCLFFTAPLVRHLLPVLVGELAVVCSNLSKWWCPGPKRPPTRQVQCRPRPPSPQPQCGDPKCPRSSGNSLTNRVNLGDPPGDRNPAPNNNNSSSHQVNQVDPGVKGRRRVLGRAWYPPTCIPPWICIQVHNYWWILHMQKRRHT